MKFIVLCFLSLFLVTTHSVMAAWPPKNPLCEKARLSELSLGSDDLCAAKTTLNPAHLEALNDLNIINQKASKFFNVPLAKLFPEGLAINITTSFSGLNGSAKASSNLITLSNYENPYRLVNKGVYAHELGHALSFSKNALIPAALKSTHRSQLLGETIADTIAFALVGEETSHELNLPLCFSAKRVTYNQTYNNHTGFFDHYYNLHLLTACCEEYAETNAVTKKVCENFMKDEGGETIHLPPYNQSRFNYLDKVSFEEHRIGIPINSFLLTLGQHSGKDLFTEFIQFYSTMNAEKFECNFSNSTDEKQKIITEAWSLKTQLQLIRSNLKFEEKINYDVLWSEMGLQAAVIIDDAQISSRAETSAQSLYIKTIKTNPSLFKDYRSCADDFENIDSFGFPSESCNITCLKLKNFSFFTQF